MRKGEQDLEKVRSVIEAVLVTADTPVTPGRLTALFDGINGKDVRNAVDWLNERYEENSNAFTIVEIGGGFQLATRQEFGAWVRKYHGGKDQVEREEALRQFKANQKDVLVSTDVAGKGLDFPDIQHVINFDMPGDVEEYVHRWQKFELFISKEKYDFWDF